MMGAMPSPRRLLCGAAFAAMLVSPAPVASAVATPGGAPMKPQRAAAPKGPLGKAGRWFTDRSGALSILHGINMVDKRPPYQPAALASAPTTRSS